MSPGTTNIVVALGREAAERAGEAPTIARRPTLTSGELLLRCAVHLSPEAHDIADHVAQTHPVPRVRACAIAALAAVREGAGRAAVLERGMRDRDARVRDDCARRVAT
jgi:hypothetical protein